MKYIYAVVALLLMISSASLAQADVAPKYPEISVSGGITFPSRPLEFKNFWKKGFSAGAGYGIVVGTGDVGYSVVQAEVEYSSFAFNADSARRILELGQTAIVGGSAVNVLSLFINYRGTFAASHGSIGPYLILGVGVMNYLQKDITADGTPQTDVPNVSRTSAAWQAGLGVNIPFTDNFVLFVEGKSVIGLIEDGKQYFPICAGIRIVQ